MARKRPKRIKRKFYRLNHYIQAQEVRVVDEKGEQIGVMVTAKALAQAREKGLDLVEVAPQAQPPVCKIIDFKKFRYLESKKAQEEKKKSKRVEIKEVRLTPFMAEGDFEVRLKRAKKFLSQGHRVKLSVKFKGRQLGKKDFGYQILGKALEKLKEEGESEREPKFIGRRIEIYLKPTQGGKNAPEKKVQAKTENQKISHQKV